MKKLPKVTETVRRLLAIERAVRGSEERIDVLTGEVRELRRDLNTGLGKLLGAIESLGAAIDRIAEIRPRLDALDARVTRLEQDGRAP